VPTSLAPAARRSVVTTMAGTPLLSDLARPAVEGLAGSGRLRSYRRGTYLFHQGDPADEVFFLVAGRIEIGTLSSTGHRQLITALDHPEFFGEFGVLGHMPRTATAIALEESDVWVTGSADFLGFLEREPRATLALLKALARQIAAMEAHVEDLLFLDLKGRVAKRLLGMVVPSLEEIPEDGAIVPSEITHADLAALSGGSRENVTRILSELARRGLVERSGRRYVLKDVAGLRRLAGL